ERNIIHLADVMLVSNRELEVMMTGRRTMVILGFFLVSMLTFGCTSGKTTVVTSGSSAQGISVIGSGQVFAAPDLAKLTIGVQVQDKTVAAARDAAAKAQQAVLDSLAKNGVDPKDIHTVQFSIAPQYTNRSGVQVLQGYQVTNTVAAT